MVSSPKNSKKYLLAQFTKMIKDLSNKGFTLMEMMVAVTLVVILAGVGTSIMLLSLRSTMQTSVNQKLNRGLSQTLDLISEGVKYANGVEVIKSDGTIITREECISQTKTVGSVYGVSFRVKDGFGESIYTLSNKVVSSSSATILNLSDTTLEVTGLGFDWSCGFSRPDTLTISIDGCQFCNTVSEIKKTVTRELTMYNSF